MATITDVAKHAGVSVKTVSRVMNGYAHISPKTRDKVKQSMRDLGYVSGSVMRQMRMGEDLSIGVLYSDPSSGYQAKLNHALLQACSDAGRYLAMELFDENNLDWAGQVQTFLERTQVGNLILVPPMCDSSDLHALLKERNIKFVLISPSRPVAGATTVTMDDRLASKEMVNHFIELGHSRIGHISGHPDHVATLLRRQGYEEAIAKAGLLNESAGMVESGLFSFRSALDCANRLLTRSDRPTAIFAANDEMAAAVISVANHLRLRVPEDLSVAGFDDAPISKTIWPELTTVAQPFEDIAREAVRSVDFETKADDGFSGTRILKHNLLIRASSGRAPLA